MSAGVAGVLTPLLVYMEKAERASRTRHPHAHAHTHMDPPPYLKHPQHPRCLGSSWGFPLSGKRDRVIPLGAAALT